MGKSIILERRNRTRNEIWAENRTNNGNFKFIMEQCGNATAAYLNLVINLTKFFNNEL